MIPVDVIQEINFRLVNGNLAFSDDDDHSIQLNTQWKIVALIMNVVASIFPCCSMGAISFNVDDDIYYVAYSEIQDKLGWNGDDSCASIDDLKQLVYLSFSKKEDRLTSNFDNLPISPQNELFAKDTADNLVTFFKASQEHINKSSGYHVYLKRPLLNKLTLEVVTRGNKDQEIEIPSHVKECGCCKSVFEHTFKTTRNELCDSLTTQIAKYNMIAVYSKSGNLLLVPDTRKENVKVEECPHLFALKSEMLKNVFAALITALNFLHKKYPDYQPDIEWHVGTAGSQTVGVVHTRIQKLPRN